MDADDRVLTDYLDWRWCLFVNVAITGAVLTVGRFVLPDPPRFGSGELDATSAVLADAGETRTTDPHPVGQGG